MTRTDRFGDVRASLSDESFHQTAVHRVMVVGRYANGTTDVVACLIRAMRNLGHHVLHIDPSRHRGLLENPLGMQGGHGPIYVKYDYLAEAITEFRPHFVILMAGGLVVSEQDAEKFRQRGVVLIGTTLSDPDVFESVADHVGRFDIHTTNAHRALGMYEDQGVRNTLYFPFGVDRDFVTNSVDIPDEFLADVICLGHATARPERDGVMRAIHTQIGDRYRVRGYGRGWSLPESRTLEGLDVLRASRGGRIHINFPATRAGYTNIKCGIFETIASGGLLVTQKFSEMERFFDYDLEIVGYDTYEEIPDLLESLLADPDKVDEMRERAFRRLTSEHLYEHRWMHLFDDLAAGKGIDHLEPSVQSRLNTIASTSVPPARPIIVSGFYGARNFGDELILKAISSDLQANVPGAQVFVVGQNPAYIEKNYGLTAVARREHAPIDDLLRTADAFLLGGGGLWHDYTFEQSGGITGMFEGTKFSIGGYGSHAVMAQIRKVPFFVAGLGVGPLADPDAELLVAFLASGAEKIVVRDQWSRDKLQSLGIGGVEHHSDVVYALDLPDSAAENELGQLRSSHLMVGLNVRKWDRGEKPHSELVERIAKALLEIEARSSKPLCVIEFPMQEGSQHDRGAMIEILDQLPERIRVERCPSDMNISAFLSRFRSVDVLLGMRLHACLLAHRSGVPAVGISYDPKVTAHFDELDRSEFVLDLGADPASIASVVDRAINEFDLEKLMTAVAAHEISSKTGLRSVSEGIARVDPRRGTWGIPRAVTSPKLLKGSGSTMRVTQQALESSNLLSKVTARSRMSLGALRADEIEAGLESLEYTFSSDGSVCQPPDHCGVVSDELRVGFFTDGPPAGSSTSVVLKPKENSGDGYWISFLLSNHYASQKNEGRAEIFVRIPGCELLQDLAIQKFESPFSVFLSGDSVQELEIGVRSRTTLKKWNWHMASVCKITDVSVRRSDGITESQLRSLDPFFSVVS